MPLTDLSTAQGEFVNATPKTSAAHILYRNTVAHAVQQYDIMCEVGSMGPNGQ